MLWYFKKICSNAIYDDIEVTEAHRNQQLLVQTRLKGSFNQRLSLMIKQLSAAPLFFFFKGSSQQTHQYDKLPNVPAAEKVEQSTLG